MSLWKQLLILVVLGGLGYGGYLGYLDYAAPGQTARQAERPNRPAIVEVAEAELRSLRRTIEAVGTTRARQSVDIVPEASGQVTELAIEPGMRVEEGAVLVRLDDSIARADLEEAEARLIERERAVQRLRSLLATNAVAEATVDDAVARLAEARAQADRARRNLEERTIRAPFGGVVGLAEIDRGARVEAGMIITRLDDLSEVEVEFALPETLFAQVMPGLAVRATGAAFPGKVFEGQVESLDSRIDPVSRSFRTRAVIPNPDNLLPGGMFLSLEITLDEAEAIVVPEEALVFQAAETYVFVVEDGVARRVSVVTGQRRDGMVAIIEGVAAGSTVITRGLHRVRDGGAVQLLSPTAGAPQAALQGRART